MSSLCPLPGRRHSGDTGERRRQRGRETEEGFYLHVTKSAPTVRQSAGRDGKGAGEELWRNGRTLNGGILPFLQTHTHTQRNAHTATPGGFPPGSARGPSEVTQPTAALSHQCPKTGERRSVSMTHDTGGVQYITQTGAIRRV